MEPSISFLIIAPAWLGDLVMMHSLLQILKQRNPDCLIDVVAPQGLTPVVARMPEVNDIIPTTFSHGRLQMRRRYQLGKQLRARQYDQAIILPHSYKSALLPYWAKIPRRTGYLGEMRYGVLNDIRFLPEKRSIPIAKQFVALGMEEGEAWQSTAPQPWLRGRENPIPAARVHPSLGSHAAHPGLGHCSALNNSVSLLTLCPGAAFGPAKQWFAEYYAQVARHYLDRGWEVSILGSEQDERIGNKIAGLTENKARNLCGTTTLDEAINILAGATWVITNDSGLMHVAAALGCKLICIYGASSPDYTPPLSSRAIILKSDIGCSPCFKRECPFQHMQCMREITPDRVLRAMAMADQAECGQ